MFKFIKMYTGLPKKIYILFLVQFINCFGNFVVPFLSLYLISKLKYSSRTAGILVTCAVIVQVPGSMLGGIIGDHWSRKATYIISQTTSAFCILLCGIISYNPLIVALLIASSFFNGGTRPSLNAMAFDLLELKKRKIGYSLLYLGINLGVSVGPILAGFLFNHYLRLFFIVDALTSFIAVLLVLTYIKDPKKTAKKIAQKPISTKSFILQMLRKPQFNIFFLIYMMYCFVYVQNSFSLPLMLRAAFSQKGTIYYGYLMSINAVTVLLATALITHITREKTSLFNIATAGIFYCVGFGMIGISNTFFLYAISTILWTLGEVLISTNSSIYVVNSSDENIRTRCTALMLITNSIGRGLGVFTMGGFIDNFGISSVWPFVMTLALTASIITYMFNLYVARSVHKSAL
jgi:MFS family permease